MSSAPEPAANDAATASKFTDEGLPLERSLWGTATAEEGGPSRRIDCRPPRLVSAPSIRPSKGQPSRAPLAVGPNESSLIDDDDDELVDYFATGFIKDDHVASLDRPTDTSLTGPRWNVREHDVPALPPFYPLDKSSVFVPRASAPLLAARVSAVLRDRSIAASYDAPNCKVDCVSKSHVEFRVRLYRGTRVSDRGIILEVQRRFGFSLSYAQDVRAILDASEGKSVEDRRDDMIPIYHEDGDGSTGRGEEDHTTGFVSLRIISDILRPRGGQEAAAEGRDLALSSLASLTSLGGTGRVAAHFSNELLSSEAHADLRRTAFSDVSRDPARRAPLRSTLLSLEIFANAAAAAPSRTPLLQLLSESDYTILHKLVTNIESVVLDPHAANLSCLILKHVYKSGTAEDVMPPHYKERLLAALPRAAKYGVEFHFELQENSQQCLELMLPRGY